MKANDTMLAGMREAMSLLQSQGPGAATAKIQQTLSAAMPVGDARAPRTDRHRDAVPFGKADLVGESSGFVSGLLAKLGIHAPADGTPSPRPVFAPPIDAPTDGHDSAPGQFLTGSYSNRAGTRAYKLYVPSAYRGQSLPLVVMLHGCMQTPDDIAAGTKLNTIAEDLPCLVLYPAQSRSANATLAWGWFNPGDQTRDLGEPSLIAGMTREILSTYGADPARVYIAGLSAGGAMAAVMGANYPELYAAVGSHSGMPYRAANDWQSALTAMRGAGTQSCGEPLHRMPIIVFHGDRDETVHPSNSDRLVAQFLPPESPARVAQGQAADGYPYTRTVHQDPDGKPVAEQWLVHGAGHAWLGGSRRGSFTDTKGPDAAREMMRFFASHAKP
jgi:poly(hydroxyalkanoate) depolymerase family esterase